MIPQKIGINLNIPRPNIEARIAESRGSHIEDEDFVSFAHKGGFQNQAAGFGDRHEVANDVGMGDGQRAALCQLFAETGNDGTVAA